MNKKKKEIVHGQAGGNMTLKNHGADYFVKLANKRWHPKKKSAKK